MNTMRVLRFKSDGETEVLLDHGFGGRTAVALGLDGVVYIGLPTGEIVRLEADGRTSHYASLLTRRMVFGTDGALYAIVGDYGESKSIVRITDVDTYSTLAAEIDGKSLGFGDAHISPALDTGFYVFTEQERNLFFVDYAGQGYLIANLRDLGGGGPAVMAASPVTGDIYCIPHGPYTVFRIDAEGNSEEVASRVFGDPWGMVVSHDGKWLFVAESGVIDRIPISTGSN
jgi:sugar lactone lactonase YvrE